MVTFTQAAACQPKPLQESLPSLPPEPAPAARPAAIAEPAVATEPVLITEPAATIEEAAAHEHADAITLPTVKQARSEPALHVAARL